MNITRDYERIYSRLKRAEEDAVKLAMAKIEKNESDITMRTAFKLNGWNPKWPIEHAAEWYDFDFEFADSPDVTSLKANYRVKLLVKSNQFFL